MEWGLEAVVRGSSCTSNGVAAEEAAMQSIDWFDLRLDDYEYDYAATFSSGDDFVEAKVLDDLEAVYRPFYPGFKGGLSSSATNQETEGFESLREMPAVCPVVATPDAALAIKYKRRKNQQKRVVEQVTADGLSSDKWAWRKYGQKPIKGSPYPRSYYRCSSSKGCSARKQVERSTSDPDIFIVSYTGEHNHMQPARRNALAGSTRSKFSTSGNNKKSGGAPADAVESPVSSSVVNSPTCSGSTPLASSPGSAAGGGSEDGQTINFSDDVFTEKFLLDLDGMDWNDYYGDLLQASQPYQ